MIAGNDESTDVGRFGNAFYIIMLYVIMLGRKMLYGECGGLNRMDMYKGEFAYRTSNGLARS